MKGLDAMANVNKVAFTGKEKESFKIGISEKELDKRTDKDFLATKKMLAVDAPEFENLEEGDKKALKHLVKAARVLDEVYMIQDNNKNLEFKNFLEEKAEDGDKKAEKALVLFNAQKGMSSIDRESNMINLMKGNNPKPGKGFYPEDLEKEEFTKILKKMLKDGEKEEVKKILNQRSMVVREGKKLKAIDYTEYFAPQFTKVADELEKAAKVSTNKDFNEYLNLQAKALRKGDPKLDAAADKKWATLQDTPLEFTISREQYSDMMSGTVIEDKDLSKMLDDEGIEAMSKDSIGGRVGIINKKGTEDLLKIKEYMPLLAKNMPYADEYQQTISSKGEAGQTMVDVDLVTVTGDEGAYRAGVTLAQNLPNGDKLSVREGGGRRNVYHRQIRQISEPAKLQKRLDAVLDKSQHKYYNNEADHWFTIGHENAHSLGPKEGSDKLGKYKDILEENKADMGSLAFLDLLEEKGMYDKKQKEQIIVTFCADDFLKSKPTMNQAHRVRSVMQNKYFMDKGAMEVTDEGKVKVNIDKVVPVAKEMLAEIVKIQKDKDFDAADKFVNKYFVWTDGMEAVAKNIRKVDKTLNGKIESPLADKLDD